MNRKDTGEFLALFFFQRKASFIANVYKASITGNTKDIHRARLDVKNIFALYTMLEMLSDHAFDYPAEADFFQSMFRHAGRIREIQVHRLLLENYLPEETAIHCFHRWLKEEEKKSTLKFLQSIKKIREKKLEKTEQKIREICQGKSIVKIRSKTKEHIHQEITRVVELLAGDPGEKNLHQVRKHLKAITTITTLVNTIRPEKNFDTIITGLNRVDLLMGDWHDRVVFRKTIEKFLQDEPGCPPEESTALFNLRIVLREESEKLKLHFIPELEGFLRSGNFI